MRTVFGQSQFLSLILELLLFDMVYCLILLLLDLFISIVLELLTFLLIDETLKDKTIETSIESPARLILINSYNVIIPPKYFKRIETYVILSRSFSFCNKKSLLIKGNSV